MKAVILAAFAALALAGCSSSDKNAVIVPGGPAQPQPPIEGVYPDCHFGVVSPDVGGPARCAKPST